jgi:hypothetical protein
MAFVAAAHALFALMARAGAWFGSKILWHWEKSQIYRGFETI